MLLGVIADDFTGASDVGSTLAKGLPGEGGLHTAQFLGVPQDNAPPTIDAGVIALKSRSIAPDEAVAQSLAALTWLQAQGCRQIMFKYCSTFDSTPEGNIGPVGEALAEALGAKGVVACPAFPTVGRTVYQGHLFVNDRLLNESGLENHPVNPMTDADIRRWLALQSRAPVGHLPISTVSKGAEAISQALSQAAEKAQVMAIVDAISDEDLIAIGKATAEARLITGGSGIALALPGNFIAKGLAQPSLGVSNRVDGPEAILAGSCSGATRRQLDVHAQSHPVIAIDVEGVMDQSVTPEAIADYLLARSGQAPLAFSSGTPEQVSALQSKYGRAEVSEALDSFFGEAARLLVARGVKRLVVAGGETSGAVVSALDLGALTIGKEIDPGVPALFSTDPEPIGLALKSGNFGAPDFFAKALRVLKDSEHG